MRVGRITSSQFLLRKLDINSKIKNWEEMEEDMNINFKVGDKFCEVRRDMRALTLSNLLQTMKLGEKANFFIRNKGKNPYLCKVLNTILITRHYDESTKDSEICYKHNEYSN